MQISINNRPINVIILLSFLFLSACAQKLVVGPSSYPELKKVRSVEFHDDMDKEGLKNACIRQLEVLEKALSWNGLKPEKRAYYEEMADITRTILSGIENPDFDRFMSENFEFFRAGDPGSVLFTGYYAPLLHGSREMTERYRYPVYGLPDDLIYVDLEKFGKSGKIKGAVKGRELVPYYKREDIENGSEFKQNPILYVDDKVALFFLHVQGSGLVQMEDGSRIRLNYADNNGFSYTSIGRKMIDNNDISRENMSMDSIKEYFRKNPDKIDYYLNQNPSYVFFKEDTGGPFGSTGSLVTAFRSVAADKAFFPKFGPAYIATEIPDVKDEDGSIRTKSLSALVFDQDSGGAIKGPGRIDIYFGEGDDAAFKAGFMKYPGNLYYLKKKNK